MYKPLLSQPTLTVSVALNSSLENLAREDGGHPTNLLHPTDILLAADGRRKFSTCSGYSTGK